MTGDPTGPSGRVAGGGLTEPTGPTEPTEARASTGPTATDRFPVSPAPRPRKSAPAVPARRPIAPAEIVALVAIVVVAVTTRFIGLAGRGGWDADQGRDMLVLLHMVRDGTIPLLGPVTSIGDFHHGPLFYYLLAPAALVSNADPTFVVAVIAAAGVAAVVVTWWLARSIAGPVAGVVAALLMAVSASAISESTFLWNPNLVALSSAVALAAAWRARTTGHVRWWLVSALGVLVTMQAHAPGIALLPPVVALWAVSWRATPAGPERRRLTWAGLACAGILILGYVPYFIYELGHGFSETRAALAFLSSGGTGVSLSLPARLLLVALRILSWPLTGLLVSPEPTGWLNLAIGTVSGVLVAVAIGWRSGQAHGRERTAIRWLGLVLIFGWLVLTFGAAGLATVTPLPVDHYHAFLDPAVFAAVGIGVAAAWRATRTPVPGPEERSQPAAGIVANEPGQPGADDAMGRQAARSTIRWPWVVGATLVVAIGALVAWNVAIWPPGVAADGGWPGGRAAGDRIEAALAGRTAQFVSLPDFKTADAYRFPVELDHPGTTSGATDPSAGPSAGGGLVVVCDSLFVRDCGGPAEDAYLATRGSPALRLVDRWEASPGRTISIYVPVS